MLLLLLWVVPPMLFMRLNKYFDWPMVNFYGLRFVGIGLILGTAVMDIYLFGLFKVFGKGTPVPIEPSKKLVAVGPYVRTRNPMYLGHLAIYLGVFLYFGHLALLLLLLLMAMGLHLLVTQWEEPGLKRRLGKDYLDYVKKVPRWI